MDSGHDKTSFRNGVLFSKPFSPEPLLWLALAVASSVATTRTRRGGVALLSLKLACFVGLPVIDFFYLPSRRGNRNEDTIWREPSGTSTALDPSGNFMAWVLVPVLLSAMARHPDSDLEWMSLSISIFSYDFKFSFVDQVPEMIRLAVALWSFASKRVPLDWHVLELVVLLRATYHAIRVVPALHRVFTRGEWAVVSCLSASILFVWTRLDVAELCLHNQVALVGVSSCFAACSIQGMLPRSSLTFKLFFLVLAPLASVEFFLLAGEPHVAFPRSLVWIASFLLQMENPMIPFAGKQWLWGRDPWPRYYWLVYWMVVLVVALAPAVVAVTLKAPDKSWNSDHRSTVVARKRFHLLAVVLFVPVTLAAPQLQSLSYAIALAGLLVLEAVRSHFVFLNNFYVQYVDRDKQERGDSVIVSHLALVVGCAAPLWIAEFCWQGSDEPLNPWAKAFLSLWGVLCVGVGDAAGAVVGVYFGRHCWSANNRRTIEGSLAVLVSMALPCWLVLSDWAVWLPAVVFTAALEACTLQLDNLVLPLAGSAVVLLCLQLGF